MLREAWEGQEAVAREQKMGFQAREVQQFWVMAKGQEWLYSGAEWGGHASRMLTGLGDVRKTSQGLRMDRTPQ